MILITAITLTSYGSYFNSAAAFDTGVEEKKAISMELIVLFTTFWWFGQVMVGLVLWVLVTFPIILKFQSLTADILARRPHPSLIARECAGVRSLQHRMMEGWSWYWGWHLAVATPIIFLQLYLLATGTEFEIWTVLIAIKMPIIILVGLLNGARVPKAYDRLIGELNFIQELDQYDSRVTPERLSALIHHLQLSRRGFRIPIINIEVTPERIYTLVYLWVSGCVLILRSYINALQS